MAELALSGGLPLVVSPALSVGQHSNSLTDSVVGESCSPLGVDLGVESMGMRNWQQVRIKVKV